MTATSADTLEDFEGWDVETRYNVLEQIEDILPDLARIQKLLCASKAGNASNEVDVLYRSLTARSELIRLAAD